MIDQTFAPAYGQGSTVSVTATSASTTLGFGAKSIVLTNTGAASVYVRTGVSGLTATTADYIVLPLAQVSISKPQDATHVAYVCGGTDTSTLNIIPGEGF
jgi:hypothetical protein